MRMTSSDFWDADTAARYDADSAEMYEPQRLAPVVDALERLADGGPALEFAIGTGRVGLALADRGIPVSGIELSAPMIAELRRKPGGAEVTIAEGDMATTRVPGEFALVYLVFNTLGNLRTQEEQVACFRNAARHLRPGGAFAIELWVPGIRRMPPGQNAVPFDVSDRHLGFDTYDTVTQRGASHHYTTDPDSTVRHGVTNFRYVWPAECDLMAQLAGLEFESRQADWCGSPFTAESESHVSVWRRPEGERNGCAPS